MQPCYICLEVDPPPLVGLCACRDRAVHAECLSCWVERSQESTCPVCLEEYRGDTGEVVRSEIHAAKQTRILVAMTSSFVLISVLLALSVLMDCQNGEQECAEHALIVSISCLAYIVSLYMESVFILRNRRILV